MGKRLYRSNQNKVIAGVCGGVAEYLGIDSAIVRLIWLVLVFAGGTGVLAYIAAVFIMPEKPMGFGNSEDTEYSNSFSDFAYRKESSSVFDSERNKVVLGGILIAFGAVLLFKQLFPGVSLSFMGPILLILVGLAILYKGKGRRF